MKKLALITTLLLTGCANHPLVHQDSHPVDERLVEKVFIGAPGVLGMEGSSVRLNQDWVLTVGHNWPMLLARDVTYHPACDVALIRDSADFSATTDTAYVGEDVYLAGYPALTTLSVSKGKVLNDFIITGQDCLYTATSNSAMGGMSGGGAFDSDGNLVGVNIGFANGIVNWSDGASFDSPAIILTIYAIQGWIEEVTGYDPIK